MALVDPQDDSITRYVVTHYRYDPERHERRHVPVVAYDNEAEMEAAVDTLSAEIRRARASREDADVREHASGHVLEAGHRARAQNGRLVQRAMEHGVRPPEGALEDLPPGMDVVQVRRDD